MGRRLRSTWAIAFALYALALALLLFGLDTYHPYAYNWENNTLQGLFPFIEQPSLAPFHILEGLMTDGGSSPWVVFPAWLSFSIAGPSLLALRLPTALLSAFAVPLLYILARNLLARLPRLDRRLKEPLAVLSALLLALSPVFMVYARTATAVGLSLPLALLTILTLLWLLQRPDLWWRTIALLGALMLGAYGYAPIRFLWPLCVVILLIEAVVRRKDPMQKRRLLASALFLVLAMASFITAFDFEHDHDPIISVGYYYAGRGEQIANLIVNAGTYNNMIGNASIPLNAAAPLSPAELAWNLFSTNARDMANLFLDKDTSPAPLDYWNPHGRLIPWWLLPFLLLGLARVIWLGIRPAGYRWRVLVLLFLGFTFPLLLTSQVHIGRLIFAVPLICLLVAIGLATLTAFIVPFLTRLLRRAPTPGPSHSAGALAFSLTCMALLVAGVALSTLRDYSVTLPSTHEVDVTNLLHTQVDAAKARGGGVALVTNDLKDLIFEEINANQYRLALHSTYRYYNIATGDVDPRHTLSDTRPPLYIGGLLDKLQQPDTIPGYCKNIYDVAPDLLPQFQALVAAHSANCPTPIEYVKLP